MLFGEAQTSDNKELTKPEEKLNTYLNELPVLGFNSGDYDLNAVKKIMVLYLIEHHIIKFTVKKNNNHVCLKTNFLKPLRHIATPSRCLLFIPEEWQHH